MQEDVCNNSLFTLQSLLIAILNEHVGRERVLEVKVVISVYEGHYLVLEVLFDGSCVFAADRQAGITWHDIEFYILEIGGCVLSLQL